MYFQLLLKASWVLPLSCLGTGGVGSAQHLTGWEPEGTGRDLFPAVLSPWVDITSSATAPGWSMDWVSTLTVKWWGQAESDNYICIFFASVLFPYFITWGLQKSICLCSINGFPNRKDILNWSREAEKTWGLLGSPQVREKCCPSLVLQPCC